MDIGNDCGVGIGGVDFSNCTETEEPILVGSSSTLVCTPYVGMEFDTVEASAEFWRNYGYSIGFGGRIKNTNRRKKDQIVTSRTYVCSRMGKKAEDSRRVNSKHRAETRCECGVLMSISLNLQKRKYYVTNFVGEHNHFLEGKETIHQLRPHRSINESQSRAIDVGICAGLGPTMTHRYMSIEVGGLENLGFTREDVKTHLRTKRSQNMELGEASVILDYFKQQSKQNPSFFHVCQLDCEGKITNFFWANPKMLVDYEAFGDVVSFDTTFGTNKESRPLGIFTGFNNHRQTVVFGGILLYDETAASFEWLSKVFLECHGGKKPGVIFTDQDAAMKSALGEVMPMVCHALCTWHISQNALKNLMGTLRGNHELFMFEFHRCMYDILDIDELVVQWRDMTQRFGLSENKWLQGMYEKKNQFCIAFLKETFTAGTRSTQLSESVNVRLKRDLGSGLTMQRFFNGFDMFLADVRNKEAENDCHARQTFPHLTNKHSTILKQAAEAYTPNIFNLFSKQYDLECAVRLDKNDPIDYPHMRIAKEGIKAYMINFDPCSMNISCTCCLYKMRGYLCAHILRVFNVSDIDKIPEKYIMKRWTMNAKSNHNIAINPCSRLTNSQKIDILSAECRRVIYRAVGDDEMFEDVRRIINNVHSFIDKKEMCRGNGKENDCLISFEPVNNVVTGLKKKISHKGGGKRRFVSCTEGGKKAKKTRTAQQKEPRSQPVVVMYQSSSQVTEGLLNGDDDLVHLTLSNIHSLHTL